MPELDDFYRQLKFEINQDASGWEADPTGFEVNSFVKILTNDLSLVGVLEAITVCHHYVPSIDARIHAYGIPEDDDRLDIVVADYRTSDTVGKLLSKDIDNKIMSAIRFINFAFDGGYKKVDFGEVKDMLLSIYEVSTKVDRINIILVSNAENRSRSSAVAKSEYDVNGVSVYVEVWDLERFRRFRSSGSSLEPIQLDVTEYISGGLPCVRRIEGEGYPTVLAIVPGALLYHLYDMYGSRLLELNVRSYLQARGKINQEILATLITRPHRFVTYNNGITVVAEDITFDNKTGNLISIRGMQIVNGGQTTASIHRAAKNSRAVLDHVAVQAKITIVDPSEFDSVVPLISRYSNTQNKVSEVDLGANHPYHVGIERKSRTYWIPSQSSMWFYERARGSYQTERVNSGNPNQFERKYPPDQVITKEDVARYSNIWNGHPDIVSKGGQKNFSKFMLDIGNEFEKDWQPTDDEYKALIAKAIFYKAVQEIAKNLKIPGYRINIVNYTAALIANQAKDKVDLKKIWDRQSISSELKNVICKLMPRVQDLMLSMAPSGANIGEQFKKSDFWNDFKKKVAKWDI